MSVTFTLTPDERRTLGELAQRAIVRRFSGENDGAYPTPPDGVPPDGVPPDGVPPDGVLHQALGSFVTLVRDGQLRGCIGTIVGQEPLWRNVCRMAVAAAFDDPRFPPLRSDEWPRIRMEISVLGPLLPCPDPQAVEVGRHGLLLQCAGRSGVFLPKVPVEQGWDRAAYLENLCRKAGLPPGSWQRPEARLYWYEALAFPVEMGDAV